MFDPMTETSSLAVVAEVRIIERAGAAIGVCEFPPALELGTTAEHVLAAMKSRLRAVIEPPPDGSAQQVRIVWEDRTHHDVRIEMLR